MKPDLINTQQAFDSSFMFIFWVSLLMLAVITVAMVYFVIRYRRSKHPVPTSDMDHNLFLELVWTVIPSILVVMMFWYGWAGFLALRNVPEGALEVKATARMWSWSFEYPNGRTSDRLIVPVGEPVKVLIHSLDVLHSFYVPAFRVKRDAVPGMETYVWFRPEYPGSYDIFCAEYCGVAHADMITTVEAQDPAEFAVWYQGEADVARQDLGRELLSSYGCLGCHSLDGSKMVGPTLQGIWEREVVVLVDGAEKTLKSDEAYLRRAILQPGKEIVKGYPPVMPAFSGKISGDDLETLLDYLKPQPAAQPAEPSGSELATNQGCSGCHSADGTPRVGPSFKGLYGSERKVVRDGERLTIKADEAYLIRAIRNPSADITEGFPPAMPPYPALSEEQLESLLKYLEGLK